MSYDTYILSEKEKKTYYMVSIAVFLFLGYLFYQSLLAMVLMVWAARILEPQYCSYMAKRRREQLCGQFRDFLYSVGASFSSGRQMESAILEAQEMLTVAYGGDAVLCRELSYMAQGIRESRQSVESLLTDFAQRSGISDIRQFVNVYCICKTTGGDLQRVVEKTVETLLDKISVRRELHVITAQKRMEANVLAGISVGMIALLNLVSPEYLQALYCTIQGRIVMTAAAVGIGGAYAWSIKLTECEM